MALVDEVTNRFSEQSLRNMTNPDAPEGSSYDAVRLASAVIDATAEFGRRCGVAFSLAVADHVDVAVDLVVLKCMERGGASITGESSQQLRTRCESACAKLASTNGGRTRVKPTTDSVLTPTPDQTYGGQVVRPDFDRGNMSDRVPGFTSGGSPTANP